MPLTGIFDHPLGQPLTTHTEHRSPVRDQPTSTNHYFKPNQLLDITIKTEYRLFNQIPYHQDISRTNIESITKDITDTSSLEKSSSGDLPKKLRGNSAYDLIADENTHLERLLKKFISKEKMKQQQQEPVKVNKKSTVQAVHSPWWINQPQEPTNEVVINAYGQPSQRRSISLNSLTAFNEQENKSLNTSLQPRFQPQPYAPSDFYIRGRSSHHHKLPQNVFLFYQQPQMKLTPMYYSPNPPKRVTSIKNQEMASQSLPTSPSCQSPASSNPSTPKKRQNENKNPSSSDWGHQPQLMQQQSAFNPIPSKLVYGLSDKSNVNKYIEIVNNRLQSQPNLSSMQGLPNAWSPSSSKSSTPEPESAPAVLVSTPKEKKLKKKKKESPSSSAKEMDEESLLMQLTDDEKVQFILQSNSHKNRQTKNPCGRKKSGSQDQIPITSSADDSQIPSQTHERPNQKQDYHQQIDFIQSGNNNNIKETKSEHQYQFPGLNKQNRSLSCESLNNKNLIDFNSYQAPQSIDYSSPFDFAKTRFINSFIQSGQKNPDPFKSTPKQTLVTEVKNKFEKSPVTECPPPSQVDNSSSELRSPGSAPRIRQSISNPSLSSVSKTPARNPVKPFLSRGSVAERVLLFEKCPEVRSERKSLDGRSKDTRSSSKSCLRKKGVSTLLIQFLLK